MLIQKLGDRFAAVEDEEDWTAVALNNGIPINTAYGWMKSKSSQKKRGGGELNNSLILLCISFSWETSLIYGSTEYHNN